MDIFAVAAFVCLTTFSNDTSDACMNIEGLQPPGKDCMDFYMAVREQADDQWGRGNWRVHAFSCRNVQEPMPQDYEPPASSDGDDEPLEPPRLPATNV